MGCGKESGMMLRSPAGVKRSRVDNPGWWAGYVGFTAQMGKLSLKGVEHSQVRGSALCVSVGVQEGCLALGTPTPPSFLLWGGC